MNFPFDSSFSAFLYIFTEIGKSFIEGNGDGREKYSNR